MNTWSPTWSAIVYYFALTQQNEREARSHGLQKRDADVALTLCQASLPTSSGDRLPSKKGEPPYNFKGRAGTATVGKQTD